jgi:hypothetical protein
MEFLSGLLIFFGRRARSAGAAGILLLQLGFAITGNFGFFNLLSFVLCIPLFGKRARGAAAPNGTTAASASGRPWLAWIYAAAALWIGGWQSIERVAPWLLTSPVRTTLQWAAPFRSFNDYGLFAVMTTTRPELIFEASDDGTKWREIEFRWKPGDLSRRPRFTGPHMPRLDWQMWFAALNGEPPPWVFRFARRVLEGSRPVVGLLAKREARAAPPRFMRVLLYNYRFTTGEERRKTGQWWKRELIRPVSNVMTLQTRT